MRKFWYVQDRIACGGMFTEGEDNKIVETAPIWRRWIGFHLEEMPAFFKFEPIE
jgi:hypothetical protein